MADVQLAPGDLVETATHELLAAQPDWSCNMQIIDLVNQRGAGPVVLQALRKRLNHKKHSVGVLAVILLEALVKNCPSFVPLVADQEFLDELLHTLPRQVRDPHNKSFFSGLRDHARDILAVERYDKTLLLLQQWGTTWSPESEAVRRNRRLGVFCEVYRQLQRAGVHFPAPERDEMAPVVTPQANQKVAQQRAEAQRRQLEELAAAERDRQQAAAPPPLKFTDPELVSAVEMCTVLTDLLTQSSPSEDLHGNELVQTLVESLRPMTANIAKRLATEAHAERINEPLLAELLQANEICIDTAAYYDGLLKGTVKRRVSQPAAPAPARSHSRQSSLAAAPAGSSVLHAAPVASSSKPSQPAAAAPAARKPVAVPLIPPPSESPTRARKSSSAAGVSPMAGSPAAAAPAPVAAAAAAPKGNLLDLDLLFSAPAAASAAASPAPASSSAGRGAPPPDFDFFSQSAQPAQYAKPAQPPAHQSPPKETSGETAGGPAVPVYVQQQELLRRAQEQKMRQQAHSPMASQHSPAAAASVYPSFPAASAAPAASANRSAFSLAPPPAAEGPSAQFFVASPTSAASSAAAARPPAAATPFDSPEQDDDADPFAALAVRHTSPPAQKKKQTDVTDAFADLKF